MLHFGNSDCLVQQLFGSTKPFGFLQLSSKRDFDHVAASSLTELTGEGSDPSLPASVASGLWALTLVHSRALDGLRGTNSWVGGGCVFVIASPIKDFLVFGEHSL